ncbi:hypothetical protein [Roseobacter sp.]|uniref:hypothetical protein n=1 Tax=Roseobacter sp. TaxID=1907202 RepID=UPI0029665CEB|nr:hypothetical protein [Roseobacter sp.]MDW3183031.1 hypothetical protein [Roseobacter sp.]
MLAPEERTRLIAARRNFTRPGYDTYADAGVEGDYITPYHLTCGNPAGPVLISYNWLDAPTVRAHRDTLRRLGMLPQMLFNRVLDLALGLAGLARGAVYLTHAFHLLPASRSATVPASDVEASFDAITRHEVAGRPVVALGQAASHACTRFGIAHHAVPHPSARGLSMLAKARAIAKALGT